jgi:hypothetical protein
MRVCAMTGEAGDAAHRFAEWLKNTGDGNTYLNDINDVLLPDEMFSSETTVEKFVAAFYSDALNGGYVAQSFANMAILATKNEIVDQINSIAINLFPGDTHELHSADTIAAGDPRAHLYPTEFLNSINLSGESYLHPPY